MISQPVDCLPVPRLQFPSALLAGGDGNCPCKPRELSLATAAVECWELANGQRTSNWRYCLFAFSSHKHSPVPPPFNYLKILLFHCEDFTVISMHWALDHDSTCTWGGHDALQAGSFELLAARKVLKWEMLPLETVCWGRQSRILASVYCCAAIAPVLVGLSHPVEVPAAAPSAHPIATTCPGRVCRPPTGNNLQAFLSQPGLCLIQEWLKIHCEPLKPPNWNLYLCTKDL